MNKKILIEKVESAPLAYQIDESSEFLGFLEGIAADSNEKTRNGRRYPIELWRNVEASPEFKEMMATRTCFGETDHPFDDRVDSSIKEVAIVLLSFDINNDGKVYCKFGILDTPNGKLLKSILDAGCQIGVSSRGVGEEITKNGEVIIDPDSYVFYGFDAVVMPAVISARPTMTEAKETVTPNLKSLSESFNREIESARTKEELESIRYLAEKVGLPDSDSLKESINIKLESLSNRENISSKLESDLGELAQENEDLKARVTELESMLAAKNIRLNESREVIHRMRDNSRDLSETVRESMKRESKLKKDVSAKDSKIKELSESLNTAQSSGARTRRQLREAISSNREMHSSITSNASEISQKDREIARLRSSNQSLTEEINRNKASSQKMIESKDSELNSLRTKLGNSQKTVSTVISRYLKRLCLQENLDYNTVVERLPKNFSMDDAEKVVKEFSDRRDRLNKVPVAVAPRKAIITESYPDDPRRAEDAQTMLFLSSMKNS